MLNALAPETVMPIKSSSETCVCIRGHFEEFFYDENGNLVERVDMIPSGMMVIDGNDLFGCIMMDEKGEWVIVQKLRVIEDGDEHD